jgi:hydroxyacylglutathione hydrolase
MATLEIHQFPCWQDNYGILIHDPQSGVTAAIDAPQESAVREALKEKGLKLSYIFTTHHHHDHVEGHLGLKHETGCKIYGPANEAADIPGIDATVKDGDRIPFGSFDVRVVETPGHTRGQVTYFIPDCLPSATEGARGVAFTGDTLFSVGCGRVIEGNHAQMWHSLKKIAALPPETLLYCGHEYTQSNIRFALTVEPGNKALIARKSEVDELRGEGKPTLPVTLAGELQTNPFLRPDSPEIRQSLDFGLDASDEEVFEELRRRKDRF